MNDLKYIDNANNFYIHLNKVNIGSRANKNLSSNFSSLKQQMATQLKAQYINLMSERLKAPAGTLKAISSTMNLSQEELMNKMDAQIRKELQQGISTSKLQALFDTVKGGNLNQCLKNAVNQKSIVELNKAFEILAKCLDLLEGRKGQGSLGAALLVSTQNSSNFSEVGGKLAAALNNWKIKNNLKTIKRQSLEASFNQLQNLANVLQTGAFKTTGNTLTADGLITLLSNGLVSTSIAEGLAFSMRAEADNILHGVVAQSVGTKAQVVQYSDGTQGKVTGKTDVLLPNVKINLEGTGKEIILDIGISSKFYTGQAFLGNLEKTIGNFGSGSGGSLKEALQVIFPGQKDRYLAYNYMAHDMYIFEMNDLIVTRQLLRLFSTTGSSQDFVQYMLVNGRIISIWQLIQYAVNTNLGLNRSMGGGKSQGIVLTIPDRSKFKDTKEPVSKGMNIEEAAWIRAREQNSAINAARIYAKIHLKNLAQAMGNQI